MMPTYAFCPLGNAVPISATVTDQSVLLPGIGNVLHIMNAATDPIVVAFGALAADSDPNFALAIPAGEAMRVWVGRAIGAIAVRTLANSGTVYVTRGEGL